MLYFLHINRDLKLLCYKSVKAITE